MSSIAGKFRLLTLFSLVYVTNLELIEARKGFDVSRLMFGFDLRCFKEKGYDFIVVRAYRTFGCFPDPDGSDTIKEAEEAGFQNIDIYMSPCPEGYKSASTQVDEMSEFDNNKYVK